MTSTGEPEPETQNGALMQKLEPPLVPPLRVPHYSDSSSVFTEKHSSYHMLGHCLRTNIFPGAPVGWSSLVKDSYVNHPLQSLSPASQCWYGRRTDDMKSCVTVYCENVTLHLNVQHQKKVVHGQVDNMPTSDAQLFTNHTVSTIVRRSPLRWTERNIINQRLQKALRETEKKIMHK